jgi:hypothetical protein
MRVHRVLVHRIRRIAVLAAASLMLGVVTATTADAGTTVTGWGSIRQVALADFNNTLYMAWIDPHANNELTITSTTDGIHFAHGTHPLGSGNSNSAPALAVFNGRLWLAWTGTDANSTLNLSSSANGTTFTQAAQPLGRNNSPDGPAMTVFNGKLYYAWKGTDSNQTLNLASSANGSTFSAPIQPGHNSSINAPSLAVWKGQLYMAWSGTDTEHSVNLASSTDGVNFSRFAFSFTSNFQPSLGLNPWQGSLDIGVQDPISHLDVWQYVGQQSVTGFAFGFPIVEAPAITAYGQILVIAWLGTDPGHTINVCFMNSTTQSC